jgi:hypothetical protein
MFSSDWFSCASSNLNPLDLVYLVVFFAVYIRVVSSLWVCITLRYQFKFSFIKND